MPSLVCRVISSGELRRAGLSGVCTAMTVCGKPGPRMSYMARPWDRLKFARVMIVMAASQRLSVSLT